MNPTELFTLIKHLSILVPLVIITALYIRLSRRKTDTEQYWINFQWLQDSIRRAKWNRLMGLHAEIIDFSEDYQQRIKQETLITSVRELWDLYAQRRTELSRKLVVKK